MTGLSGKSTQSRDLLPPHTRIAIPGERADYDVIDVEEESFPDYVSRTTELVTGALRGGGVAVPAVALREVIDNLVHAAPCSASMVIDPQLNNIFISDTGPGISRLDLVFELGYSTATPLHRSYIRGVGIGLYLAREDVRSRGGDLRIEADAGKGTFVQISLAGTSPLPGWAGDACVLTLSQRQNNILFLLSEGESLGPSRVSAELNIGVSTAHRDLVKLQELGLIYVNANGKRFLSDVGRSYLQSLLSL